jgi:hypothetical protein
MHVWVLAAAAAAVGSIGLGLATSPGELAPTPPLYPMPAPAAYPSPCPAPPAPTPGNRPSPHKHRPPKPLVSDNDLPPVPMTLPHTADLGPVSGKGMWLTTWAHTQVDVDALVAAARAGGLRQLWVRTGGTRQGWYGEPLLTRLLPAAHRAGVAVIAWDFPTLSDPLADSFRASQALAGTFGGEQIDGFSPDIETKHEGTFNSPQRVALYLAHVRLVAGDRPVVATVMRPTDEQLRSYPYRAEAPYVDAFAPMDYWSCHEPGETTAASIQALATLRPVAPVGQAYNMASEGGRRGMPTAAEIWRFVDSARRAGAIGASLYNAQTATADERQALDAYPWSTPSTPSTPTPAPSAEPTRLLPFLPIDRPGQSTEGPSDTSR